MRRRHGITVVEVLVVTLIIAILAAIVYGVAAPAREQARQSACMGQLRQIYSALEMYAADYEGPELIPGLGHLKPIPSSWPLEEAYGVTRGILYCPNSTDYVRTNWGSSYSWVISATPNKSDPRYTNLVARLAEKGDETPIVICTIHDETYYLPREEGIDPDLLGRYEIQLRVNGSIWRGRQIGPRTYRFTRGEL